MQPPIAGQVVLGWDPAFRTGCKLAVVDPTGKVLGYDSHLPDCTTEQKWKQAKDGFKEADLKISHYTDLTGKWYSIQRVRAGDCRVIKRDPG